MAGLHVCDLVHMELQSRSIAVPSSRGECCAKGKSTQRRTSMEDMILQAELGFCIVKLVLLLRLAVFASERIVLTSLVLGIGME